MKLVNKLEKMGNVPFQMPMPLHVITMLIYIALIPIWLPIYLVAIWIDIYKSN